MGKLLEQIVANRLRKEIEEKGGLAAAQCGFVERKSTITALQTVVDIAEKEMKKTLKTRGLCVLITLDIKNAFNTASWAHIINELTERGISTYLRNIIMSYFKDREIIDEGEKVTKITRGVPQGSVLGPLLWNVCLLKIRTPSGEWSPISGICGRLSNCSYR